ncbi:MAG: ABC transporter substrate-binding protein [Rhodospirillales bacterium]|jgi:spermidine/putrescine-binding protein|nr:ABC transporter substrate-binding protein [Rhodospirillales bacterium]
MKQWEFNRRYLLQGVAAIAAAAAAGRIPSAAAATGDALRYWASGVAKVGAKDFSAMEKMSGAKLAVTTKSARADEAIQKMVVGDGNKLFDALTDNGGGMEDALASQKAIVPVDPSRIPNWKNILPAYREGGKAADTIRHKDKVYAVPYISNADSMAYDRKVLGFDPDSWGVMFDSQFKGRVALQNDFGPTLTSVAIYLKGSGKIDIKDASDMAPDEVKAVCQFLIDYKKKGHFRTFWDGFQNGVSILASGEVLLSSCWEPVALVANKKAGDKADIRYGTMKEGHQTWNNVVMFSKGGKQRGMEDAFYKLANTYLSPWFGAMTLKTFGFAPQMVDADAYMKANFDAETLKVMSKRLADKNVRYAVKGNAWQNVFPTHIRAYQDWWARLQAA